MANNCSYDMKVCGKKKNVEEFIRAMRWEGEYGDQGVGRVFSCDACQEDTFEDSFGYHTRLYGDCAGSIWMAMEKENDPNNIKKLAERLNLKIEVISEESGIGFMEHKAWSGKETLCYECAEWVQLLVDDIEEEIENDDIDDEFWNQKMLLDEGITKDNYKEFADDTGVIRVGGVPYEFIYV